MLRPSYPVPSLDSNEASDPENVITSRMPGLPFEKLLLTMSPLSLATVPPRAARDTPCRGESQSQPRNSRAITEDSHVLLAWNFERTATNRLDHNALVKLPLAPMKIQNSSGRAYGIGVRNKEERRRENLPPIQNPSHVSPVSITESGNQA